MLTALHLPETLALVNLYAGGVSQQSPGLPRRGYPGIQRM